jgi:F0F1-type ATP synthase assembly protein I
MQDHPYQSARADSARRDSAGGDSAGGNSDDTENELLQPVPEPPRLNPKLPAHPAEPQPASQDGRDYGKAMIASSAVTAFLAPIVVLCLGGYWLDQRMKHTTPWFSMIGVILGLVLGVTSLIRVLDRLSKD